MKDTPQPRKVSDPWWSCSPDEFYRIVHEKQDALRNDQRFGYEVQKGNGPGRPSSTRLKVSD